MQLHRVSSSMPNVKNKITVSELAQHKSKNDCWTAVNGRVYNITSYIPYHPGGVPQLMKGAGVDSTELFKKFHPWVNLDSMLAKFIVGTLVPDPPATSSKSETELAVETISTSISAITIESTIFKSPEQSLLPSEEKHEIITKLAKDLLNEEIDE